MIDKFGKGVKQQEYQQKQEKSSSILDSGEKLESEERLDNDHHEKFMSIFTSSKSSQNGEADEFKPKENETKMFDYPKSPAQKFDEMTKTKSKTNSDRKNRHKIIIKQRLKNI